jgi:eukaryotic-like serine/threonine-protein kinase
LIIELLSPPDAPAILFLTCHRTDSAEYSPFVRELPPLRRDGRLQFVVDRVEVGALAADDSAALTRARLGPFATEERVAAVAREALGNPFLIEAMAAHLIEISVEGQHPCAMSLEAAIGARVARLTDGARRLLHIVAVAGRLADQDLAVQLAAVPGDPHNVLFELRAASLLRTSGPRRGDFVEMYHDRVRESVLDQLPGEAIRHIHSELAQVLATRADAEPDIIAFHYFGAGEPLRAADYALRAAERAWTALAFERAASMYRNALDWGGERTAADRLALETRIADALFNAGRSAEAAPVYLEASQAVDGHEARRLRGRAIQGYLLAGHVDAGLTILRPLFEELRLGAATSPRRALLSVALQLLRLALRGDEEDDAHPREAISKDALLGIDLCWSAGNGLSPILPIVGVDFYLRSLSLARRAGDRERAGRVQALLGGIIMGFDHDRGERYLARAESLASRIDSPYLLGLCEIYRAMGELNGRGRWQRAFELVDRGIARLRDECTGAAWECAMGVGIALKAMEQTGEIEALGIRAAEWSRDAEQRGDRYVQMAASYCIALRMLAHGDVEAARAQARWNLAEWGENGYTAQHYYAMRIEALCDLYEGDAARARARLDEAMPQLERAQLLRLSISRFELRHLDACIQLTPRPAPHAVRRSCERIALRFAREIRRDGAAHADWIRAALTEHAGDRASALVLLDRSARQFADAGMPLFAQCLVRRRAELSGDEAARTDADSWMRAHGIVDPARWTRVFFPAWDDDQKRPARAASMR